MLVSVRGGSPEAGQAQTFVRRVLARPGWQVDEEEPSDLELRAGVPVALVVQHRVTPSPGWSHRGGAMGADGGFWDWEQEAERRDRAAEQRDQDAAAHDELADERDRFSRRRDELASIRDQAAHQREQAALQRDWAARARDHAAELRDRTADRRGRPTDASQLGGYEQAAIDRELDASDRQAAAEDRAAAAQDRAAAAGDERAAVADRAAAAGDRDLSSRDRAAAAQDRSRAAADREQAVVERAQHDGEAAPDWVLGQAHRRVQAVRGRAQETARTAAGVVERFIQAKQSELAAHVASIQIHEQLASLQERFGHPERAAESRAKAERAQEFHRLAEVELAEYLARVKAVEDRKARRRRDGTGRAGG